MILFFLVVSGTDRKNWKVSWSIWKKGEELYQPIREVKEVWTWQKYFQQLEEKPHGEVISDVRDIAEDLHHRLRVCGFTEEDKPLFISACLLALKDPWFFSSFLRKEFDNEEDIIIHLGQTLERVVIEKDCLGLLENLKKTLNNKGLLVPRQGKHQKSSLKYILQELQEKIFPLIKNSNIDVIGEFYHEFLKYSGGDAKGLGIVLTPSHIADLFTELVDLKPTHKVLDICCGTGTFLVAALNKMLKKSSSQGERNQARENLYGIEINSKIYNLALTNMIIWGNGKSHIYNSDCFDTERIDEKTKQVKEIGKTIKSVSFDIGFLNPPYSQKDHSEGEFVLHLLNLMKEKSEAVVIIPTNLAIGTKFKDTRKSLLENHTLKAVMAMPPKLFSANKSGSHTCIMVWIAHQSHKGKTWLASWRDDGFITQKTKRIEKDDSWSEIKKKWLKMYRDELTITGISTFQLLDKDKIWLPEEYLEIDYNQFSEEEWKKHFRESMRDYLGYIMIISPSESNINDFSFSRLAQELEINSFSFFSLNTKDWQEFALADLFDIEKAQTETFFTGLAEVQKTVNSVPLISHSIINNGYVGFIDRLEESPTEKGNCLTVGYFGNFFYQPVDFYLARAEERGSRIICLRASWLNEKRGLFISTILRNVHAKKWDYGRVLNGKVLRKLTVKLPIIQEGEQKGKPDWEFMENYIKRAISSLSLSLSLWRYNFFKN